MNPLIKFKNAIDIPFCLVFGTALGAYRDKDFIEGDENDIDVAIEKKYYDRRKEIDSALTNIGFVKYNHWQPKDGLCPQISYKLGRIKIDIFFIEEIDNEIAIRFYKNKEATKYITKFIDKKHFDKYRKIQFLGEEFNIPSSIEKYLESNYGDWKTPVHRKDFSCYRDNQCREINSETAFTISNIYHITPELIERMNDYDKVILGIVGNKDTDISQLKDIDGYSFLQEKHFEQFVNKIKGDKVYFKTQNIDIKGVDTIEFKPEPDPRIKDVDFIIKTFQRYDCLGELLDSLCEFYPEANITVLDDSKEIDEGFYLKHPQINLIKAKYDIGLSEGRNRLIKRTKKKYVLLLDDDFIFTPQTNISKFIDVIESNNKIGVVGGLLRSNSKDIHYEHDIVLGKDNILRTVIDEENWKNVDGIKCRQTGCVLNFALFRRTVFKDILWDKDLKIAEHTAFYFMWPHKKWKIYYTPEVVILNNDKKRSNVEYNKHRDRGKIYLKKFMDKYNIDDIINRNGISMNQRYGL